MRRTYAVIILVIVGAAIIGSMVANRQYTQHVADVTERRQAELRIQQDRRWCDLFALLDPAAPPESERGRQVQAQLRFLREAFHCKETAPR